MRHKNSSSESGSQKDHSSSQQGNVVNIRTKPAHVFDSITRRLLLLGVTLAVTTFVGLIVRYAVQEFDPAISTITVTTSRINNRDIASLSVSKNFLERILEFIEESLAIIATVIPIGFPLCTIFNRYIGKMRAGSDRFIIKNNRVLNMIPKYVVLGDSQVCQMPDSNRLRPLVRDTIYHLIKARMKPKLISEDSYEDARKLGIRIGLIKRDHHKLAVIKSVDLLKNICDSRGDIKQGKVRYLLSRMKIMSQSTPADKSLLVYLIKHCESLPNENLAYLGYAFTDPEAMKMADCSLTFQDCDDDDVKRAAHVVIKSEQSSFTDVYLFIIVCLITSNITQSYALYQISAAVSSCIYRFLSITVFQKQLLSHSQFGLLVMVQQVLAIMTLMTKWISSLPQTPLRRPVTEMSHAANEDSYLVDISASKSQHRHHRHRSVASMSGGAMQSGDSGSSQGEQRQQRMITNSDTIPMQKINLDDTLGSSSLEDFASNQNQVRSSRWEQTNQSEDDRINGDLANSNSSRRRSRPLSQSAAREQSASSRLSSTPHKQRTKVPDREQPVHLSGADLDQAIINSKIATNYKQTFRNLSFIDDITYRLAKLHIAYQVLVMIIIMIFGNTMFQLNPDNSRQHQTLALNSLIMNNIFNLANCFNQFGAFNLKSGFKSHPFFVCVLLLSVAVQVCLTELNAFGLENLNPTQWFVCLVFALLSALIAPLTGQQRNQRQPNGQQTVMPTKTTNVPDHGFMVVRDRDVRSSSTPSRMRPAASNTKDDEDAAVYE